MARSRSIPTKLFWDPKFSDLDGETQSIYIGLTLESDDHGRGLAHVGNLARAFNKEALLITRALDALEAADLISRYQVDEDIYYQHRKWNEWQRLDKRTPSQYPAPPNADVQETDIAPAEDSSRISPDFPGKSPLEEEGEENKNEKRTEEEVETRPANVIPLDTSHGGGGGSVSVDERAISHMTQEVAKILKLPASSELRRVVADFLPAAASRNSALSLLGEADAAHEYINSPSRNHRHKVMSPTFYRQWLKRERDNPRAPAPGQSPTGPTLQATGTAGSHPKTSLAGRSLMNLESEYQGHTRPQQKGNQP